MRKFIWRAAALILWVLQSLAPGQQAGLINQPTKAADKQINMKPVFASAPENAAGGKYWFFYLRHKGFYYEMKGEVKAASSCIRNCIATLEEACVDCTDGSCCVNCPLSDDEFSFTKMNSDEMQTIKTKKAMNVLGSESKQAAGGGIKVSPQIGSSFSFGAVGLEAKTMMEIQDSFSTELKTTALNGFEDMLSGSEKNTSTSGSEVKFTLKHHYGKPCARTDVFVGPTYCEVYAMCDVVGKQALPIPGDKWDVSTKEETVFCTNLKVFINVFPTGAGVLEITETYACTCKNCPNDKKTQSTSPAPDASAGQAPPKTAVATPPIQPVNPANPPKAALPAPQPALQKLPAMTSFAQVNVKKGDKVRVKDPYGGGAEITSIDTGKKIQIPPGGEVEVDDMGSGFIYSSPALYSPLAVMNGEPVQTPASQTLPKKDIGPLIDAVGLGGEDSPLIPIYANGTTPPMTVSGEWPEGSKIGLDTTTGSKDGPSYPATQIVDVTGTGPSQSVVVFDDVPPGTASPDTEAGLSVTTPSGEESDPYTVKMVDGSIISKVIPEDAPPNSEAVLNIDYTTVLPVMEKAIYGFKMEDYLFTIEYPKNITGPATAELNQTGVTVAPIAIGPSPGTYDIFVTLVPKDTVPGGKKK